MAHTANWPTDICEYTLVLVPGGTRRLPVLPPFASWPLVLPPLHMVGCTDLSFGAARSDVSPDPRLNQTPAQSNHPTPPPAHGRRIDHARRSGRQGRGAWRCGGDARQAARRVGRDRDLGKGERGGGHRRRGLRGRRVVAPARARAGEQVRTPVRAAVHTDLAAALTAARLCSGPSSKEIHCS